MDRNDFHVNPEELMNDLDKAEVVSISFPTFDKSAVFDMRSHGSEGPMLRILPIVASPRERIRTLRRLRPRFPRANGLTVIPWHGYVDTLVERGIWGRIAERFIAHGGPDAANLCHAILMELKRCEKGELSAAIRGDNYHTIWTTRN